MDVLFICTGNICRSPTAERFAAAYGHQSQIADLRTSSAGTHAVVGHPIHGEAARVLSQLGGDAAGFAARQLTPQIAADADLVLTMTMAHRTAVLEVAPHQLRRTFTLTEASRIVLGHNPKTIADLSDLRALVPRRDLVDIPDPIDQNPGVFSTVGSQIADLLPPILELCRRI